MHKRLVYFNFIEGKLAQARKRRISGTKIIDGNFYARALSLLSVFIGVVLSVKREDSVTSSSRRSAGSPVSFRIDSTIPTKALLLSWTGETFTEILAGTAQQAASCRQFQALLSHLINHSGFSATGIKLSGDRRPFRGWSQRIRAS